MRTTWGHGLGILAVDVEDRCLEHAGDVRGVARRAARLGRRGEADLVVDHDVDRAAGAVALQIAQVEDLLHHALTGESRVAVDQDPQAAPVLVVPEAVLLGADAAHEHRVDELEMARVETQREVHLLAGEDLVGAVAQVVLHVTAADVFLGLLVGELAEDLAGVFAHDVDEHVQTAAVGHADHHLADLLASGFLERQVDQRDERLGAFEGEALGAQKLAVDELLEELGVGQLGEDVELLVTGQVAMVRRVFEAALEPVFGHQVVDVHELPRRSTGNRSRSCAQ